MERNADMGDNADAARMKSEDLATSTLPGFNPSKNPVVDVIKMKTDELMQYIEDHVVEGRRRSLALTGYEQAAMWAVKAATNVEPRR
jgi:hypothetical protein